MYGSDSAGGPGTGFTVDGVLYAATSNSAASTTAGTVGQILTSNGAGVAPTYQAIITGQYAMGQTSAAGSWVPTGATFADGTNSGGNAYTSLQANGITVTAGASNVAGIQFTPASSTAIYMVMAATAVTTNNSVGGCAFKLVDASGVVIGYDQSQNGSGLTGLCRPVHLHGVYVPGTASAVTVKIQVAAYNGGTETMGDFSGITPAIHWTVIRIF